MLPQIPVTLAHGPPHILQPRPPVTASTFARCSVSARFLASLRHSSLRVQMPYLLFNLIGPPHILHSATSVTSCSEDPLVERMMPESQSGASTLHPPNSHPAAKRLVGSCRRYATATIRRVLSRRSVRLTAPRRSPVRHTAQIDLRAGVARI